MREANIVSVSGGKDSTATLLLAIEREAEDLRAVFADTGHEHQQTYEYVEYLAEATGVEIEWVRADLSMQIAAKRDYIAWKWLDDGVPQEQINLALDVLKPTGNPFLDMCLWKGRFPSTKARFCTDHLKVSPINEQVIRPALRSGVKRLVSWQGVRADESASRAKLPEMDAEFGDEETGEGLWNYRPILRWTVDDVFDMHRKHGVDWNPLYEQGMGRVGCMPCIHARKGELREIARRFPEEVERVAAWERLVADAAKLGMATFFPSRSGTDEVTLERHGIQNSVNWSRTSRGGNQYDLLYLDDLADESPGCRSIYGLCE